MYLNLETEIICTIGEADDELALAEFNLCCIALAGEVRHLGLDVGERNRLDRLSKRHVRFAHRLAVRQIESMPQKKIRIQNHLRAMLMRTDGIAVGF